MYDPIALAIWTNTLMLTLSIKFWCEFLLCFRSLNKIASSIENINKKIHQFADDVKKLVKPSARCFLPYLLRDEALF